MKIIALTLVICAAACGLGAALAIVQGRGFKRRMVRTQAVVCAIVPFGENGRLVPYVRFADEQGNEIRARAQRRGTGGLREGDNVIIAYTQREFFGQKIYNVFFLKDETAKPYGLYTSMGVVLAVATEVLIAGAAFLAVH